MRFFFSSKVTILPMEQGGGDCWNEESIVIYPDKYYLEKAEHFIRFVKIRAIYLFTCFWSLIVIAFGFNREIQL